MSLDSKVVAATADEMAVISHLEPDSVPATPTFKLKGCPVEEGKRYTRTDGTVTWTPPISIYCPVSIWDGETKAWEWTAAGGEV